MPAGNGVLDRQICKGSNDADSGDYIKDSKQLTGVSVWHDITVANSSQCDCAEIKRIKPGHVFREMKKYGAARQDCQCHRRSNPKISLNTAILLNFRIKLRH